MDPQEKARQLMIQYFRVDVDRFDDKEMTIMAAKSCCNITIDEILKIVELHRLQVIFWNKVKQEIDNL